MFLTMVRQNSWIFHGLLDLLNQMTQKGAKMERRKKNGFVSRFYILFFHKLAQILVARKTPYGRDVQLWLSAQAG